MKILLFAQERKSPWLFCLVLGFFFNRLNQTNVRNLTADLSVLAYKDKVDNLIQPDNHDIENFSI